MGNSSEDQGESNFGARDQVIPGLALYQYRACPYCRRVSEAMRRLGLNIELRDTLMDRQRREELRSLGGRPTVPCLRIEHGDGSVEWMYESRDIIRYLEQRFGASP
ncbi:MAG: glutathione S-transferase N-terminal domain-containing protein [Gammaproteobacteria bacterium]|nr:glutathione S-transferase N-terminal domain-containing protein [Gammaproteobacteria bacterium]